MRYRTGSQCNDLGMVLSERVTLVKTMLHMLKFQDVLERNILIKGIAIIKSTANKSSYNNFFDSKTSYSHGEYDEGHECDKSINDKFMKYTV